MKNINGAKIGRLWAGWKKNQGLIPRKEKWFFSHLHSIQIGSKVHPAPYSVGTSDSDRRGQAAGHEADHSPPSSAKVKNVKSYVPTSHMFSLYGA
jgi:hypothetical protein